MNTDRLFELAFQYKKTGLWNHMFEDQLFAVRLSGDRTGYVSIMGIMGEHNAVALYIGEKGLRSYHTLRDDRFQYLIDTDYNPTIVSNECLQAVFDAKDYLTPDEIEVAKSYARKHNIKIAGKNAYPHFVRHSAGFIPHSIEEAADIEDLIIALEAAVAVSQGPIVNGFDYHDFVQIGSDSAKVPLIEVNDSACGMEMVDLPSIDTYSPAEGLDYDPALADKLRSLPRRGTIQAGLMILPAASEWDGSDVPVIPTSLVVVDSKEEQLIQVQPVALYESRTEVMLNKFMEALIGEAFIPRAIKIDDEYTEALLSKWCGDMKIKLAHSVERLPELYYAKEDLYRYIISGSDDSNTYEQTELMLDELLQCSPQEIAQLYDNFYDKFELLVDEMDDHPDVPISLRYKVLKLRAMFNAARESGLVDYMRNPSRNSELGKFIEAAERSAVKPSRGRSKGSAGKKSTSGKRYKKHAVVISVSLGTGCYRHIRLNDSETLYQFADYILQAFEFFNDHAHAFFMDNKSWSEEDCYYISGIEPYYRTTEKTPLYRTDLYVGKKFKFIFDFGDEWTFQCKVLRIEDVPAELPEVVRYKGESPSQYDGWDDDWEDL